MKNKNALIHKNDSHKNQSVAETVSRESISLTPPIFQFHTAEQEDSSEQQNPGPEIQFKQISATSRPNPPSFSTDNSTEITSNRIATTPTFQFKAPSPLPDEGLEEEKEKIEAFQFKALSQDVPLETPNETPFQFETREVNKPFQLQAKHTRTAPVSKQKQNKTGLPDKLKSGVENLSGYAMDDVNVHYNSENPAQLNAHAYAQGTDIHLGKGQEKHLPHEAWHVVQQKQGRVKPTKQMKGKTNVNDDAGLEKEADLMGAKAAAFQMKAIDGNELEKERNIPAFSPLQAKWGMAKPKESNVVMQPFSIGLIQKQDDQNDEQNTTQNDNGNSENTNQSNQSINNDNQSGSVNNEGTNQNNNESNIENPDNSNQSIDNNENSTNDSGVNDGNHSGLNININNQNNNQNDNQNDNHHHNTSININTGNVPESQFSSGNNQIFENYNQLKEYGLTKKEEIKQNYTSRKEQVVNWATQEKTNIQDHITSELGNLRTTFQETRGNLIAKKDEIRQAILSNRTEKINLVRTKALEEINKIREVVRLKKEALLGLSVEKGNNIIAHGETQANRAVNDSLGRANRINPIITETAARYADREGSNELRQEALNNSGELRQHFIESGNEIANIVRGDSSNISQGIRNEAQEIVAEFDSPVLDSIRTIEQKRDETIESLNNQGNEFLDNLDQETQEIINVLNEQETTQCNSIRAFGDATILIIDEKIVEVHGKLDTECQRTVEEIDEFIQSLDEISWHSDEMLIAKEDLDKAIQEQESEMNQFMTDTQAVFVEYTNNVGGEVSNLISQILPIITEFETNFTSEVESARDNINGRVNSYVNEAVTEIQTIAPEIEIELDNAINQCDEQWNNQIQEEEGKITEKVNTGLDEQESALSDFSSSLNNQFDDLKEKDRGILGAVVDFVGDVFSFVAGVIVGIALGLWELIKAIGHIIITPALWLVAAIVIIGVVIIAAIIAVVLGVKLGLVLLVMGIIVGLGIAGYFIWQAITAEGLSPYERGQLVGRGLFEGVMAFVGTGLLARLKWVTKIGQLVNIANKVGGVTKLIPIIAKIDDLALLVRIIDKVGDASALARILTHADDAARLARMIDNTSDAGRIISFLDGASDINLIINKVDDVAILTSLIGKVDDAAQLQRLLNIEKITDAVQLNRLLGLEKITDAATLERLLAIDKVTDAAALERLLNLGKITDVATLERLLTIDKVTDAATLERLLNSSKITDAATLERLLIFDFIDDVAHLERFVNMPALSDAATLESFIQRLANSRSTLANSQRRHIAGTPEYLARNSGQGSYFTNLNDAQSIYAAIRNGTAELLGFKGSGSDPVFRYTGVTGFNNNPRAGFFDQASNLFWLKGTSKPSLVPITPTWTP